MSLEYKLVRIETLSEGILGRVQSGERNGLAQKYLEGASFEARVMYDTYSRARKAIKKGQTEDANRYVGEFALATKNMADNLNQFMQALYGAQKIHPTKLQANTAEAPLSQDGKALSYIFSGTHNHEPSNPLVTLRNMKGHSEGHVTLRPSSTKSKYAIAHSQDDEIDAAGFLESAISSYFSMMENCLSIVYAKDNGTLSAPSELGSVRLRQAENYVNRHKRGVTTAGIAALLALAALAPVSSIAIQQHRGREQAENLLQETEQDLNKAELSMVYGNQIHRYQENQVLFIVALRTKEELQDAYVEDRIARGFCKTLEPNHPAVIRYYMQRGTDWETACK